MEACWRPLEQHHDRGTTGDTDELLEYGIAVPEVCSSQEREGRGMSEELEQKRTMALTLPTNWKRNPRSDGNVHSLDEVIDGILVVHIRRAGHGFAE